MADPLALIPRELAFVLGSIEDGVTVQDAGGRYVFANDLGARLMGFESPERLLATPPGEVLRQLAARYQLLDEDGDPIDPEVLSGAEARRGQPILPVMLRMFDGTEELSVLVTSTPYLDEQGGVRWVLNRLRDVTEQRRLTRSLRVVGEARVRLALQATHGAIFEEAPVLAVQILADACTLELQHGDRLVWRGVAKQPAQVLEGYRSGSRAGPPGLPRLIEEVSDALLNDLAVDAEHLRFLRAAEPKQLMTAPLIARGRMMGVLVLLSSRGRRRFGPSDLALAEHLAMITALSLERARITHEARVSDILRRLAASWFKLFDAGALLQNIVDEATALTGAEFGVFFDASSKPLISGIEIVPRFVTDWELAHRDQPARAGGVIRYNGHTGAAGSGDPAVTSYLAAPIVTRSGKVLGRLFLGHPEPEAFTLEQERILSDIALQAAASFDRLEAEANARQLAVEGAARKEAETAKTRTTAILDSILEPFFALDRDWRLQFANHAVEKLFGHPRAELLGKRLAADGGAAEPIARLIESLEQKLPGHSTLSLEVPVPSLGSWYEIHAYPFEDGLSVYMQDVTARKRAEELQSRLINYEALRSDIVVALSGRGELGAMLQQCCGALLRYLEVSVAGIWTLQSGNVLELQASAGSATPFGQPGARAPVGPSGIGAIAQEERPYITNHLPDDTVLGLQEWAKSADMLAFAAHPLVAGEPLIGVMAVLSPQPLPEDTLAALGYVADAIAQGIHRRRAEQALEARAAELARSNAELEQFAYVASHDLQEPLRMISSYTQLLARRYQGKLDADADQFIGFAVEGVTRMKRLIDDLLTYTRVGARTKEFAPVDCSVVFRNALAHLKSIVSQTGGAVSYSPLPTVMGDAVLLEQLFENLLGNALKFRSPAPPEIEVTATQQETHWLISVKDNGIGIDPQFFHRLFIIFQRLHAKHEYPGTGIGLAICKKIVERHGGRIWIESTLGKGATFHFTLPVLVTREARGPKPA